MEQHVCPAVVPLANNSLPKKILASHVELVATLPRPTTQKCALPAPWGSIRAKWVRLHASTVTRASLQTKLAQQNVLGVRKAGFKMNRGEPAQLTAQRVPRDKSAIERGAQNAEHAATAW